jgi:hypothetical protein
MEGPFDVKTYTVSPTIHLKGAMQRIILFDKVLANPLRRWLTPIKFESDF